MSTAVASADNQKMAAIEQVLINGDLSKLNPADRVHYYKRVCETVGLNPLTKPFDYIILNGKLTLYARKDATDQLRNLKRVSIRITAREQIGDVYVVTAQAKLPDGREDESTGAVPTSGLKGDALANAFMKAETKAKRRVTLSICGLGILDETEVDSIPEARREGGVYPDQPGVDDGTAKDWGYRIPFGKYAKRSLEEIQLDDLRSYIHYIESKAAKDGKSITGQVLEFIERASAHIAAHENGALEPEMAEEEAF